MQNVSIPSLELPPTPPPIPSPTLEPPSPRVDLETLSVQQKVFTRWCNFHLERNRSPIVNDITQDFKDGLLLITLLEIVFQQRFPEKHNKHPKLAAQKLENLAAVINYMNVKGERIPKVTPEGLYGDDPKYLQTLLWALIRYYIKDTAGPEFAIGQGIINWVKAVIPPERAIYVDDLSKSWWNGRALYALASKINPKLKWVNKSPLELLTRAITSVESFGIPALLDPQDVANSRVDDKAMISYLTFYPAYLKSSKRLRSDILQYKRERLEKKKLSPPENVETSSVGSAAEEEDEPEINTTQSLPEIELESNDADLRALQAQLAQKEEENETMRKKLNYLLEWKLSIESDGLKTSVLDCAQNVQYASLVKQVKHLIHNELEALNTACLAAEEERKSNQEEQNNQIDELKSSLTALEDETSQLKFTLEEQTQERAALLNKIQKDEANSRGQIEAWTSNLNKTQPQELLNSIENYQLLTGPLLPLRDAFVAKLKQFEDYTLSEYKALGVTTELFLPSYYQLLLLTSEIESSLDKVFHWTIGKPQTMLDHLLAEEEILFKNFFRLSTDISSNKPLTYRYLSETTTLRHQRANLVKAAKEKLLAHNFSIKKNIRNVLYAILPLRERTYYVCNANRAIIKILSSNLQVDLLSKYGAILSQAIAETLQELNDILKLVRQQVANPSSVNTVSLYISQVEQLPSVVRLVSASSADFSDLRRFCEVSTQLMQTIQNAVYYSFDFCDSCKKSIQELYDMKAMVNDLTRIENRIADNSKHLEALASKSRVAAAHNLDLQKKSIEQIEKVQADLNQEIVTEKPLMQEIAPNPTCLWFLLFVEAIFLLILTLLLLPHPDVSTIKPT